MNLSSLSPASGSVKRQGKRLGRGQGSGRGGTSTKGHKGQKAISGYSRKVGFEGGQMPIQRRLPKFGFKNINRVEFKAVNLQSLENFAKEHGITSFDVESIVNAGMAPKNTKIKILGQGVLTLKLEIKAHGFSKTAQKAIEALQGTAIKL